MLARDQSGSTMGSAIGRLVPGSSGPSDEQRKLAMVTLEFSVGFVLLWPVLAITSGTGIHLGPGVKQLTGLLVLLVALTICVVARLKQLRHRHIGILSPIFLVVGALGIAVVEQWRPWPGDTPPMGISWVCLWLVVYPFEAPRSHLGTVWPALLAAFTLPIAVGGAVLTGVRPSPSALVWAALVVPVLVAAGLSVFPARAVLALREGARMGSYRLIELLDHGAMGEVWLASHRLLARPAAIKLIRPHALSGGSKVSGDVMRRFRREAQATSELQCPHTIELYDFGVADDGRFFYVMELLDGVNLQALVEEFGPLPAERAIHLIRQTCLSLAEAHRRGLIHRDVKPTNLYACRMGLEVDYAKVLDFGLVKADLTVGGDRFSGDGLESVAGTIAGTPAYMAPEVATGQPADARSDVYSLGCVLYWLLTGQLVFGGASAIAILKGHLTDKPIPPSQVAEMAVPEALDRIVLDCLAKDPDARPQTMEALRDRLDACPLERPWTAVKAERWWERHLPVEVPTLTP
ncbi:MAG: serine/threonine protein kinase [Deltaproteobacteria bacterium]|nr:serine/threonine protein kinase [Deltaproteobacteria bacterium]